MVAFGPFRKLYLRYQFRFEPLNFFLNWAVIASPRRAFAGSGRFANGQADVCKPTKRWDTARRKHGVNPFLIFAMNMSSFPS